MNSQIDNEQIEAIVNGYSEYCKVNSQNISESEDIEQALPAVPKYPDFQAVFENAFLSASVVQELKARSLPVDNDTQPDYDSQTDAETVLRMYRTENPHCEPGAISKVFDLKDYCENYMYSTKSNTNATTTRRPNPINRNKQCFTLGPVLLEVEDIHQISTICEEVDMWRSQQKIYGQNFKTVMFYGRCKPYGSNTKQQKNVKLYEVDDCSGRIIVHFSHFDNKYSDLSRAIERLTDEYETAKQEGIPFLGTVNYGPKTAKCKAMLNHLKIVINVIRENGAIKQQPFTHGAKVCVIGRVFGHNDGTNHVLAYHMIEDNHVNRDFEIKFKEHLANVYETKYLKFKVSGESCVIKS